MKKTLTLMALLCLSVYTFAQQDPQFTQFTHNKLFMNPAYAGMKHGLCFTGIARQQWVGFEGAPKSGILSADIYLEDLSGGVGLNLMYDELGFEKNLAYRIAYSFHRDKIFGGTLGIGVEAGATTKILGPTGNQSWIASSNWQNDPTVPPQMKDRKFDCGVGVWYQRENLWFGVSATHINAGQFYDGTSVTPGSPPTTHNLLYNSVRHYWVTGGYNLQRRSITIKPSFLVKTDAVVTSIDLNCIASLNNGIWFGASWRVKDAICPMIGFEWLQERKEDKRISHERHVLNPEFHDRVRPEWNKYSTCKIGFAYDYTTSGLNSYTNGTFEIVFNYCIPYVPRLGRHGDVRIFN